MPVRRSRRRDCHSLSDCPLPNKFDESYERFRENFKKISRRCASLACTPGSSDGVVIEFNKLIALSKTSDFPTLETFGSDSSALYFPDFSWTSTTNKRSTFDDNSPCSEPTDICISRCNSSKLAFSMFEKSSMCAVQKKPKYHGTVLQNILDEEENEADPLTDDPWASPLGHTVEPQKPSKQTKTKENGKKNLYEAKTEKRTGKKIISQDDAEDVEIGARLPSKAKTTVKKDANMAEPSKHSEKKVAKSEMKPAKTYHKSDAKTAVKKDANTAEPSKHCEKKVAKSEMEPAKTYHKSDAKTTVKKDPKMAGPSKHCEKKEAKSEVEPAKTYHKSDAKTVVKNDANMAEPSKHCEKKAGKSEVKPAKTYHETDIIANDGAASIPLVDKQMRKVAAKKKPTRNKRIFKLRFETFPTIVSDIVNVPVPQESMLCEPRQKTTNDVPSAEEDMMRLNYLFDHLRLTQDRIQLWLDMGGETYPRQKK